MNSKIVSVKHLNYQNLRKCIVIYLFRESGKMCYHGDTVSRHGEAIEVSARRNAEITRRQRLSSKGMQKCGCNVAFIFRMTISYKCYWVVW